MYKCGFSRIVQIIVCTTAMYQRSILFVWPAYGCYVLYIVIYYNTASIMLDSNGNHKMTEEKCCAHKVFNKKKKKTNFTWKNIIRIYI